MPARSSASSQRNANRRLRTSPARDRFLDVQIRSSTARRQRNEVVGRWVTRIIVIAAVGMTLFVGVQAGLDKFFFRNPEYLVRTVAFDLDDVLTPAEATEETGVREGINIFSIDLAAVEARLEALPQIRSAHVERELPGHIAISLKARHAVAWIAAPGETGDPTASEKSLLADATGFLMRPRHFRPEYFRLPTIYGVKPDLIRSGDALYRNDLRLALDLLAEAAKAAPTSLFRVRTLDISKGWCIEAVNDDNARIIFGTSDFPVQLARLDKLLQHCADTGRSLNSVNLVVKRNPPVTFVVAASTVLEDDPETGASSPPARKGRRN